MLTFKQLQDEVTKWSKKNFGEQEPHIPLLGAVEELGELAHAYVKLSQSIRTSENHYEAAQDAVADCIIYLADYCGSQGFDLQELVEKTWSKVKQRDWKKDPVKGGE